MQVAELDIDAILDKKVANPEEKSAEVKPAHKPLLDINVSKEMTER